MPSTGDRVDFWSSNAPKSTQSTAKDRHSTEPRSSGLVEGQVKRVVFLIEASAGVKAPLAASDATKGAFDPGS